MHLTLQIQHTTSSYRFSLYWLHWRLPYADSARSLALLVFPVAGDQGRGSYSASRCTLRMSEVREVKGIGLGLSNLTIGDGHSVLQSRRTGGGDVLSALHEVRLDHHTHDHRRRVRLCQLLRLHRKDRRTQFETLVREQMCKQAARARLTTSSATSTCF